MSQHPLTLWRISRKITQEELAQRLGVSQNTITGIERRIRIPRPRVVHALQTETGGTITAQVLYEALEKDVADAAE